VDVAQPSVAEVREPSLPARLDADGLQALQDDLAAVGEWLVDGRGVDPRPGTTVLPMDEGDGMGAAEV
jgi:hypothetical protein